MAQHSSNLSLHTSVADIDSSIRCAVSIGRPFRLDALTNLRDTEARSAGARVTVIKILDREIKRQTNLNRATTGASTPPGADMHQNTRELNAVAVATTDSFITVPEVTLPNGTVVPSFRVGQYACTQGVDGKAMVTADAAPWVRINYADAVKACAAAGYQLITELQWLAIAWDASQQDCNWTKGKVGEGKLFCGLRKDTVNSAQPGCVMPQDPKERRWLTLSNGEQICDLNGNIWQWVFDNVQGDATGLPSVIKADSPSLTTAPFPSQKKGMGYRPNGECNWSGRALIRGGSWLSDAYAGAFRLGLGWPGSENDYVGFRCTQPGL